MTLLVFPSLSGITWGSTKKPEFKTTVFESLSGQESRIAFRKYPKWIFKISFEFLIDDKETEDVQSLLGFLLKHCGMQTAFLYSDPNDNTVVKQYLGTGNSLTTTFQLTRSINGFSEPVENINGSLLIYINNVLVTNYTLSSSGTITFTLAPSYGDILSWSGSYYYKVRFLNDSHEITEVSDGLFECHDIEFVGSVRNSV